MGVEEGREAGVVGVLVCVDVAGGRRGVYAVQSAICGGESPLSKSHCASECSRR